MKKIIAVFYILLFFSSCYYSKMEDKLAGIDSLLETHPDLAMNKLCNINDNELKEKPIRVYYYLLLTEAQIKNSVKVKSDRFITFSMDYYKNTDDVDKYVRSAFYRGSVLSQIGKRKEATQYYKIAEEYMDRSHDSIIIYRICEYLGQVNTDAGNYNLAFQYRNRTVNIAESIKNKRLMALAYNNISLLYMAVDNPVKAYIYINKALHLISYCYRDEQAAIFLNMGLYLSYFKYDYKHAEQYVVKSNSIMQSKNAKMLFEDIAVNLGTFNPDSINIIGYTIYEKEDRYDLYAQYYERKGMNSQALYCKHIRDSLRDSINIMDDGNKQIEIQKKYDKESQNRKIKAIIKEIAIWFSIFILLMVMSFLYTNRRKSQRIRQMILEKQNMTTNYIRQMIELERSQKENRKSMMQQLQQKSATYIKDIRILESKLKNQKNEKNIISKQLSVYADGIKYLIDILNGGGISQLSTVQLRELIDCYTLYDAEFITSLDSLTSREKVYCILLHEGRTNKEVAELFSMSSNTNKTVRFRIREKLGTKNTIELKLNL